MKPSPRASMGIALTAAVLVFGGERRRAPAAAGATPVPPPARPVSPRPTHVGSALSAAEFDRFTADFTLLRTKRATAPAAAPAPATGPATRSTAPKPRTGDAVSAIPATVRELSAAVLRTVTGEATYYADKFEGRRTASGTVFRQDDMVAAHRAYPFGTVLRVTNTRNDRSVTVRVVDRGPFGTRAKQRNTIIDLSRRAAERLGYITAGRTPVKIEVLEWGKGRKGVS